MRKVLIIIPTSVLGYEIKFSAPLQWMFSNNVKQVYGIFGYQLTKKLAKAYEFFIIELNWFTQLHEFKLIVDFIKKHNKNSKILFGGIYSQLAYSEIFKYTQADMFIRGDNEYPIKCFLNGENNFPNLITRKIENPVTYTFSQKDFDNIKYDFSWFKNYINHEKKLNDETTYEFPMIILSKLCDGTIRQQCETCIGKNKKILRDIYCRKELTYDNDQLINLLHKLEKKYNRVVLFVNSRKDYDFRNEKFDINALIEYDTAYSKEMIEKIAYSFKHTDVIGQYAPKIGDFEIRNKKVFMYRNYTEIYGYDFYVPLSKVLKYSYYHYDYYLKFDNAIKMSKLTYNNVNFAFQKQK